jgi:hypothetical protein
MTTISTITEDDVRDLVEDAIFQRGQEYFQDMRIFGTQRKAMTLTAKFRNQYYKSYRIKVTFNTTGTITATCSCSTKGHCEHVIALLLTWLARPESFWEPLDIEGILQQSDNAELISLIKRLLGRVPDLEYLLLTVRMSIDPQSYHNRVETLLRNAGSPWGMVSEVVNELLAITEIGHTFVQQHDHDSACTVYDAIVSGMIRHYGQYTLEKSEFRALDQICIECIDGLQQCLGATRDNSVVHEHILRTLFAIYCLDTLIGGIGFGDTVSYILQQNTTTDECQTIAGWIRETIAEKKLKRPSIGYRSHRSDNFSFGDDVDGDEQTVLRTLGRLWLNLVEDTLDDTSYLHICQETNRMSDVAKRLVELGRIDEAAQATKQLGDDDLLYVVEDLVKSGNDAVAEHLMLQRAWKSRTIFLLDWLKMHFSSNTYRFSAFVQSKAQFQKTPTFEAYKAARLLATQFGCWHKVRSEFLFHLRTRELDEVLTQVALDEDDTDEIIQILELRPPSSAKSILAVVEATEDTQPEAVLHFYQRYAPKLISNCNRPAYEQATRILLRMHALYEKLGKPEGWMHYVTRLRKDYQDLEAFESILSASGLQ